MSKKEKKKKKVRNQARGWVADYYYTNKEYSEENATRQKKSKTWSKGEKAMLVVCILGLVGIFLRYVVF